MNVEIVFEDDSLFEILYNNLPKTWEDFFNKKEVKDEVLKISNFLTLEKDNEKNIYPSLTNVFRLFYLLQFDDIKVLC